MTKKERIQLMLKGKQIDYLPSQVDFVPQRLKRFLREIDKDKDEYNIWADNHFFNIFPLTASDNFSSGSIEDEKLIDLAISKKIIEKHADDKCIYDNFHISWIKNINGLMNVNYPLKNKKDLDSFDWPNPNMEGIFDHIKDQLKVNFHEFYIVGYQHQILFDRAWLLYGYENLMIDLIKDVSFVEQFLDILLEYQIGLAYRYIEMGIDAIQTGEDYGMQKGLIIDEKLWRKLIKPRLAKLWEVYRNAGVTVMHHSCGDIEKIIPDLIEIGLEVLNPIQPRAMSIERIARKYDDKICFHGGIDTQGVLPFGTPQEVMKAVKKTIEVLGANRNYIIAPSQEIMIEVPKENIIALIDGIKEYRYNCGA